MTIVTTRRAILAMPALAVLPGCALLRSPKPVPLYRFGQSAGQGGAAQAQPGATVIYNGTTFPRAAAGDRILTSTGVEVSYVAASRWTAPALILFEEAVLRGFQVSPVRLLNRGSTSRADATLRVEVRTFEARYPAPEAAPTVVVETRALLTPIAGSGRTSTEVFDAQRPLNENRVSAIAQAFDSATAEVIGRITAWVGANASAAAA